MVPLLDNRTILHYQDQIRIHNGRQTVGDHKRSTALHQCVHGTADLHFRPGIHRRGSLIQDQDGRIAEHDPGDGKELALSCGNSFRIASKNRIVSLRQRTDKKVGSGCLCSSNNLFSGSIRLSIGNIFRNGPLKKPGVLQYHAKGLAKAGPA